MAQSRRVTVNHAAERVRLSSRLSALLMRSPHVECRLLLSDTVADHL
jgi:hypothetical protein